MKKAGLSILLAAAACTTMVGYASAKGEVELTWAPFIAEGFSVAQINAGFKVGERLVLGAAVSAYEDGGSFEDFSGGPWLGLACSRDLPGFLGNKSVEGTIYAGPLWYQDGDMSYIVGAKHDLYLTDKLVVSSRISTDAFSIGYGQLSLGYNLNSTFRLNLGVKQEFVTDFRTSFEAAYGVSAGVTLKF